VSADEFLTLAGPGEAETRVKASVFLATAWPVAGEDQARALLAAREKAHWDAGHHCYAWRLRGGGARSADAGEPSGSAGAPILAALALAAAPRRVGVSSSRLRVSYPYALTPVVMRVLERAGAGGMRYGFGEGGESGVVEFSGPAAGVAALGEQLREASGGVLAAELLGSEVVYRNADD
jgi:hypothetical protein